MTAVTYVIYFSVAMIYQISLILRSIVKVICSHFIYIIFLFDFSLIPQQQVVIHNW